VVLRIYAVALAVLVCVGRRIAPPRRRDGRALLDEHTSLADRRGHGDVGRSDAVTRDPPTLNLRTKLEAESWKLEVELPYRAAESVVAFASFGLNRSVTSRFPRSRNGTPFSIHSGFGLPSK
jgi:hypothetical protein